MDMTRFESIRKQVLAMIDQKRCPEYARDQLIAMVASERALIDHIQVVAVMCIMSDAYSETLQKTMTLMQMDLIKTILTGKMPDGTSITESEE